MNSNYDYIDLNYYSDIVICFEATNNMKYLVDYFKDFASNLYYNYGEAMDEKGKTFNKLRIKIILFRDSNEVDEGISMTNFFELPKQLDEFKEYIETISLMGNSDNANALEALSLAMHSDWNKQERYRRHIIFMFTLTVPKSLDFNKKIVNNYPYIAKNLSELTDQWDGENAIMERRAKRLLIFTPDEEPWSSFCFHTNVFHSELSFRYFENPFDTLIRLFVE